MAPVDLHSPHAVAFAVADTFLGDAETARHVADEAVVWVGSRGDAALANPIPWTVAAAIERALTAPVSLTRTHDRPRRLLAEEMSAAPVAVRVAVALVGICGLDAQTAAALTRRSPEELDSLLTPWRVVIEDLALLRSAPPDPLAPTPPTRRSAPPPPPPWEQSPAPTTPQHRQHSRRRLPASVGTLIALLFVVGVVVAITVPHGERPTFAEAARRAPTRSDAHCMNQGAVSVSTLRVGVEQRPARFALPPGRTIAARLIVAIGDTGQSSQDVADTTGIEAAGTRQGDAVLTLDGTAQPWNVAAAADRSDDIAMAADAITQAAATGCVDVARTAVVGYGTGAHLAAAIACSGSEHVLALAMIRGAYAPKNCELSHGVAVVIDSDTTDAILPFDGGWGISATRDDAYVPTGATEAFSAWSGFDACGSSEDREVGTDSLTVTTRDRCRDDSTVTLRVRTGFGHDWPEDATALVIRLAAGLG